MPPSKPAHVPRRRPAARRPPQDPVALSDHANQERAVSKPPVCELHKVGSRKTSNKMAPPRPEWCSRVDNVQGSFAAPKPLPRREVKDKKGWEKGPTRAIVDSSPSRVTTTLAVISTRKRSTALII